MDATEILERAADIIAERGVYRGAFVNPDTGVEVCSSGALQIAAGAEVKEAGLLGHAFIVGAMSDTAYAVFTEAQGRLMEAMGNRLVSRFNDDPANSDEDIILCFKRAAHDGSAD